jgi:hypothetical protein
MKPPNVEKIALIRKKAVEKIKLDQIRNPVELPILVKPTKLSVPLSEENLSTAIKVMPKNDPDLGDLIVAPALDAYMEEKEKGADFLINLANKLEAKNEKQRALLVLERVIDSSKPTAEQYRLAIKGIIRLSGEVSNWNVDPAGVVQINLQVVAEDDVAKNTKLEEVAALLSSKTSGIITINPKLSTRSKNRNSASKPLIDLWFSGAKPNSMKSTTTTISLDVGKNESLQQLLLAGIYRSIREFVVTNQVNLVPPIEATEQENFSDKFRYAVTRLTWQEFARQLNIESKP